MALRLNPTADEARVLIAYHERILATTTSGDRRLRSEKAIARLRQWCTDHPPVDRTVGCDCDQPGNPDPYSHAHDCQWRTNNPPALRDSNEESRGDPANRSRS